MKINYRRIIKVLSSCVAIAMVLIATVAMPVFAVSNKVYTPADLFQGVSTEGDDVIITYALGNAGVVPFIFTYPLNSNSSYTYGNRLQWTFAYTAGSEEYNVDFRSYLLGNNSSNPYSISANFLDISDFKRYSTLSLSMTVSGDTGLGSTVAGQIEGLHFKALWAIMWLDKDGAVLTTTQSAAVTHQVEDYHGQFRFDVPGSFVIPDNAVYMIPQLRVVVSAYGGGTSYAQIYMELQRSHLYASYNSVVENSVTMNAIKDKLYDIDDSLGNIDQSIQEGNEKLDTIIDGKEEWHEQAEQDKDAITDAGDHIGDLTGDIDDATDMDKVLPEGADSQEELSDTVGEFRSGTAWKYMTRIFGPILANGAFSDILLMIVAFINISVLLLGR